MSFQPFTLETAQQKVRNAESVWNGRDPEKAARSYTTDSRWRNRDEFFEGREAITAFFKHKWEREQEYRLIKELWGFRENRMAVRFCYESHDARGQWFRSYGNELWEFATEGPEAGLMQRRLASINDLAIVEQDRLFHWAPGPRPEDHPGLSALGL